MRKFLVALVAVGLLGPAARAWADDSTAVGTKQVVEENMEAPGRAEPACPAACARADDPTAVGALQMDEENVGARERVEPAKPGDKAQRSMDAMHKRHGDNDGQDIRHARQAVGDLERADSGLRGLFDVAAGYAVFPTVGKGAVGIGGAHGTGVLFEKGMAVGNTTLTQLTVGLQLGGQEYTEVIFFESERALRNFKKGKFAMAAQVSAVAAAAGASANAKYHDGVSVFTLARGGLMAEASVGGQKFSYQSYPKPITTSSR